MALAATAHADAPGSCDGKPVEFHQQRAFSIIDHAYRHNSWRKTSLVTNDARANLRKHKFCLTQTFRHERIAAYRAHAAKSRDEWRRRERDAWEAAQWRYTPYDCGSHGRFAIPCYVVACESGYSWSAYNPSGAAGPYQIMPEHGRPYPIDSEADRQAHHQIAARLWNGGAGASNWVCA